MRNTKKAISILLTLLMVVGMMSTFAFAEGNSATGSVTIKDGDIDVTSSYQAYQILLGNITAATDNNNPSITNIRWGSAINKDLGINDKVYTYDVAGAVKFAASIKNYTYDSSESVALATTLEKWCRENKSAVIDLTDDTKLADGYYLIKQKTPTDNTADTRFMLKVVGKTNVNIEVKKTTAPDPDKKVIVKNEEKPESTAYVGMQSTFKISATLPDAATYDAYTNYKIAFKDTLPDGLTYDNPQTINVYYVENNTDHPINATNYTKAEPTVAEGKLGGGEFKVEMDAKSLNIPAGAKIVVEYTATLNKNASAGNGGETNGFEVVYPQSPKGGTVATPNKKVKIYTGKIIINKYDGNDTNNKLSGAVFVVKNSEGKYLTVNKENGYVSWKKIENANTDTLKADTEILKVTTDNKGAATITGLEAGTYKLQEIVAPTNYNLLNDDISVELKLSHKDDAPAEVVGMQVTKDIANNSGSTLPETGGIGTTIFYLIGAILVIGAGVVFVTRRRMHSDK